jgi:hypothetical protein
LSPDAIFKRKPRDGAAFNISNPGGRDQRVTTTVVPTETRS